MHQAYKNSAVCSSVSSVIIISLLSSVQMARIGLLFSAAKLLVSQDMPHYVSVQHAVTCRHGVTVCPEHSLQAECCSTHRFVKQRLSAE